jgi:hypothetical protein
MTRRLTRWTRAARCQKQVRETVNIASCRQTMMTMCRILKLAQPTTDAILRMQLTMNILRVSTKDCGAMTMPMKKNRMLRVFSQSSYKTPRKKLQANWRFLGVQHKAECNDDQIQAWLAETAAAEMAKAGPIESVLPGKNVIGGFRRAHVSDILVFPISCQSVLTRFAFFAQDYKSGNR